MIIIDGHLDLAWNALQWERDLTRSVYTLRTREGHLPGPGRAANTVALPEMRQGRIALCFATLLARSTGSTRPGLDYPSPAQAFAAARGQLAYYRALEQMGQASVLTSRAQLDAHMAGWLAADQTGSEPPPIGFIISMESADPILEPDDLADWYAQGVRIIGPAHYGSGRYAGGTGVEDSLSDRGQALLIQMQALGMVLDLTHLSDAAFWHALEQFKGTVIASHNNCRALVPHQRQFSDAQLRAIIERGGVIGVAFDAWMLQPGWIGGVSSNKTVALATVVDHIDHICQLAGNSQHVAIGSDLDGGFGREQSPHDLDTIADLQRLSELLAGREYTTDDVAAICYGNWLRILQTSFK